MSTVVVFFVIKNSKNVSIQLKHCMYEAFVSTRLSHPEHKEGAKWNHDSYVVFLCVINGSYEDLK